MQHSIAVLDQDKTFHFIFERSAGIWGADEIYTVNHYYSAEQLITFLLENSDQNEKMPSALLIELNLVPIDGWEFFDHYCRIKDLLVKPPLIIATSSSNLTINKTEALAHNCVTWYIEKPINEQKFNIIKDLIAGRATKDILLRSSVSF